ncbi:MAG: FtsX-like permease family protein, partial [Bacteroidota bacterium]
GQLDIYICLGSSLISGMPKGDPKVVISKSIAEKYFGDYTQAIGKVIGYNKDYDMTITGVIEDAPDNTDLPFDMLVSFELGKEHARAWTSWASTSSSVQFYCKLHEQVDVTDFESKIIDYVSSRNTEDENDIDELHLQKLSEVHHDTNFLNYSQHVVSWSSIYVLALVGLLLIVTAAINFINLSTALAVTRSREVGVRKVLGSSKSKITFQLLGETAVITFFATLISLGLSELVLVRLQDLIGIKIPAEHFDLSTIVFVAVIFIVITVLSGLYPAFVLSRFKPIQALKGKIFEPNDQRISLRKGLIVIQLFISQVLIIGIVIIYSQVDYFMETPVGLDTETILQFDIPDPAKSTTATLKNELLRMNGVSNVSFSSTGSISDNVWGGNFKFDNGSEMVENHTSVKLIDANYVKTHGLTIIAGNNLKDIVPTDSTRRYLINEEFVKMLGLDTPEESIGKQVEIWGEKSVIVGVVKNFHAESFKERIKPLAMWANPGMVFLGSVKLQGGNLNENISSIQQKWEEAYPEYMFEYRFLDDRIKALYESEQRLINLFGVFAFLAIFIGAIGLFGLISFVTNSRTKEIGVRKVLGASIHQIVTLLSRDFLLLVILAFVVSAPVAWYFASQWLQTFEFKIDLSFWFFIAALFASTLITLLTVSYKSIQAATANPVDSLRDE